MGRFNQFLCVFIFLCIAAAVSASASAAMNHPSPPPIIPFSRGFSNLFGDGNIIRSSDDRTVHLQLNKYTGSGFKTSDYYSHAIFSAKIKLPSDYTAGVVVAFYTTNKDIFEKNHDELDIEFMGNIKGKAWKIQTNVYGNGSTSRGREERYHLWFDPTAQFHRYTILWTNQKIIFFVDDTPIREIKRNEAMGGDYPNKPMSLYATIWDASGWATSGGKYKADYKYAPFVAEFTDLALHGCVIDPLQQVIHANCTEDTTIDTTITSKQHAAMKRFRMKHMYYSHCYDTARYAVPLPECVIDSRERQRFNEMGVIKFKKIRHGRMKKSRSRGFGSRVNFVNEDDE